MFHSVVIKRTPLESSYTCIHTRDEASNTNVTRKALLSSSYYSRCDTSTSGEGKICFFKKKIENHRAVCPFQILNQFSAHQKLDGSCTIGFCPQK